MFIHFNFEFATYFTQCFLCVGWSIVCCSIVLDFILGAPLWSQCRKSEYNPNILFPNVILPKFLFGEPSGLQWINRCVILMCHLYFQVLYDGRSYQANVAIILISNSALYQEMMFPIQLQSAYKKRKKNPIDV